MDSWLSFTVGAVAGAVIGRYSEKLLEMLEGAVTGVRVRAQARQLAADFSGGTFSFCGFTASVLVHGFDQRGIPRDAIVSRLVPDAKPMLDQLDAETRKAYAAAIGEWTERLRNGEIYNSRKLALRHFRPLRSGVREEAGYQLEFTPTDYLVQRTWNTVFRQLDEDARAALVGVAMDRVSPVYSNTFGVCLSVITADDHLVFVRRGGHTAVNQGRIVCACVEGMDDRDLRGDTGRPDPYLTALRGLGEELGLRLESEANAVTLNALVLNTEHYEWGMLGIADLRRIRGDRWTRAHIQELWNNAKGRDKYEVASLEFVPFTPEAVAAYLRAHRRDLVNYSLVATVYALLSEFPRRTVARSLQAA